MSSDNIRHPSLSRKAGRGLMRALRGLFGGGSVKKAGESWRALKEEYRRGREEAEEEAQPPKRIPHREVDPPDEATREEPPRASASAPAPRAPW